METCKICGQELIDDWYNKEQGICGLCDFWLEVAEECKNPNQVHFTYLHDGIRRHIQGDLKNALVDKSKLTYLEKYFLGFGGADWYIKDPDGNVHHYNNLWYRGEVPERFYDKFPVNAEIVSEKEFQSK